MRSVVDAGVINPQKNLFGENHKAKTNNNDVVYTPLDIAKMIIDEYAPTGLILDPCKGTGAFYNQLPAPKEWCEITENRNFYDYNKKVDWIISNPPFSDWDRWIEHSFLLADNIVYLVPVTKVFASFGRVVKVKEYGGIVRIIFIPARACGFPFGFPVGAFHFQRNYNGQTKIDYKGL